MKAAASINPGVRVAADFLRSRFGAAPGGLYVLVWTQRGRPKFIVLPHHLADFERRRSVGPPPKPAPRRQRRRAGRDYYPDERGATA